MPFVSVETVPFFSVFSLMVPILVVINIHFLGYWLLMRKKAVLQPLVVLLISYFFLGSFFQFGLANNSEDENDLSILSFNVRGFNKNQWSPDLSIGERIIEFIDHENPDILCLQEFSRIRDRKLKKMYRYKYISRSPEAEKTIQAIYSKFPIVESGALSFNNTANNAIYADIIYKNDTVRVYNLHLESLKLGRELNTISNENSARLYERITTSFKKQQQQSAIVKTHMNSSNYMKIVCGDFNNTQYSNVYRTIKGDMLDTFLEEGKNYGRTYSHKFYPLRIDFILVDAVFTVKTHQNFKEKLSDHFPVKATVSF